MIHVFNIDPRDRLPPQGLSHALPRDLPRTHVRRRFFRATLLAVALLSSTFQACVPWPHMRTITPPQQGILLRNGAPVRGAKVYQSFSYQDKTCKLVERETTTDSAGRFEFPRRRELFTFIGMGDDSYYSSLCADDRGQIKWLTYSIVVHESPEVPHTFSCELTEAIQDDFPPGTRRDLRAVRCRERAPFER